MKSEMSKKEIEDYLREVFSDNPSPKKIKKAKKLAMSKNIKLGKLKRKFCKNCYSLFSPKNSEVRIKNGFKIIRCKCGNVGRWKIS